MFELKAVKLSWVLHLHVYIPVHFESYFCVLIRLRDCLAHRESHTEHEGQSSLLNHRHEKEMVAGGEMAGGKKHICTCSYAQACVYV